MVSLSGTFEYPDDLIPGGTAGGGMRGLLFRDGQPGVAGHGIFYPDARGGDLSSGDFDRAVKTLAGVGVAAVASVLVWGAAAGWRAINEKRSEAADNVPASSAPSSDTQDTELDEIDALIEEVKVLSVETVDAMNDYKSRRNVDHNVMPERQPNLAKGARRQVDGY